MTTQAVLSESQKNKLDTGLQMLKKLDDFENEETKQFCEYIYCLKEAEMETFGDYLATQEFAETAVKLRNWLNKEGVFKNNLIWNIAFRLLGALANFTHGSSKFCQELIKCNYVSLILADLQHSTYLERLQSSDHVQGIFDSNLTTLYNIAKIQELKGYLVEANVITIVEPFIKHPTVDIKVLGIMIVATLVEEKDNDKIIAASDVIADLILFLEEALNSKYRSYQGWHTEEIADGIGRLAVNDSNKKNIVEANGIQSLKKMIADNASSKKDKLVAIKAVANLAFDAEVKSKIRADGELMAVIEHLSKDSDEELKKAASVALWIILEKSKAEEASSASPTKSPAPATASDEDNGHIMISYSWADQKVVLQIRDILQQSGFRVWMDVDEMRGSVLDAMAEAIEKSTLILMCMSEKYKNSPNCRLEAEYANQRRKIILPLLMQKAYRADGWLGILSGSTLFVDFSGKYPFEDQLIKLHTQIKRLVSNTSEQPESSLMSSSTTGATKSASPACRQWDSQRVLGWLKERGLEKLEEHFKEFNGESLYEMIQLRREAPEFFYHSFSDMGLRFAEILKLKAALDQLT